jgi:hypothetical protein
MDPITHFLSINFLGCSSNVSCKHISILAINVCMCVFSLFWNLFFLGVVKLLSTSTTNL